MKSDRPAGVDPLLKVLELCDFSENSYFGPLPVAVVRAWVLEALAAITANPAPEAVRPVARVTSHSFVNQGPVTYLVWTGDPPPAGALLYAKPAETQRSSRSVEIK